MPMLLKCALVIQALFLVACGDFEGASFGNSEEVKRTSDKAKAAFVTSTLAEIDGQAFDQILEAPESLERASIVFNRSEQYVIRYKVEGQSELTLDGGIIPITNSESEHSAELNGLGMMTFLRDPEEAGRPVDCVQVYFREDLTLDNIILCKGEADQ